MTVDSNDDVTIVDERRHHAVGIELQIRGIKLIAVQIHHVACPFQPFLRQSQPRLLSAYRGISVIKFKHGFLLPLYAGIG